MSPTHPGPAELSGHTATRRSFGVGRADLMHPLTNAAKVEATVNVKAKDFSGWSGEQIAAFLSGVAAVVAAARPGGQR